MSEIRVTLLLEDGQFTTRILHAGESLAQFNQNVARTSPHLQQLAANGQLVFTSMQRAEGSTKSFLGTVRDLSIIAGGAALALSKVQSVIQGFAGDIIRTNAEFERLTYLLKGMSTASNAMEDATQRVAAFQDMAMKVPFSLQEISNAAVKLQAAGLDPLKGSLQAVTDGVAAFGGTGETLNRAILAITQMRGKGVIQMEELRQQLGEAIPRAIELMARSMGVTMPEFVNLVATGMVESKAAIDEFSAELDRTFGGSAYNMMNTFNGQIQQTQTLLQKLALEAGGTDYFPGIKDALKELNEFLASNKAKGMAQNLGAALNSIAQGFVSLVKTVAEYSNTIEFAAKTTGVLLAIYLGGRGFIAAKGVIEGLANAWKLVGIQQAAAAAAATAASAATAAANTAAMSTVASQMANVMANKVPGGAFSQLGTQTATNLSNINRAMAGAAATSAVANAGQLVTKVGLLARIAPIASAAFGPLGIAVGTAATIALTAADAFGLFSDAVTDAWKSAERYGVNSMAEMDNLIAYVNRIKAQIASARQEAANAPAPGTFDSIAASNPETTLAALQEQLAKAEAMLAKFGIQAEQGEKDIARRLGDKLVGEILSKTAAVYDEEAKKLDAWFATERQKLIAAGKSDVQLREEYNEKMNALGIEQAQQRLKTLDSYIAMEERIIEKGIENEVIGAEARKEVLVKQRNDIFKTMDELQQKVRSVKLIPKEASFADGFKKASAELDKLRADITDTTLKLAGATDEAARLQGELAMRKYGPADDPRIKTIIDGIQEAIDLKKELDRAFETQTSIENDFKSTFDKLQGQLTDLKTRNMSAGDAFAYRAQQAASLLPDGMNLQIDYDKLTGKITNVNQAAQRTAVTLVNGLFGTDVQKNARTVVSIIDQMIQRIENVAKGVQNITSGYSDMRDSASSNGPISFGGAGTGSYVDKVVGTESGGNPTAKNPLSSATGLGQFIESTWLQFLREMQPDLAQGLSMGERLSLRQDPTLSRQAIEWYAQKNAEILMKNGQQPTDANLYLSHLLGPGDALKVLMADLTTPLKDVISASSMRSNPQFAGKTVENLLAGINAKMGQQVTISAATAAKTGAGGTVTVAPGRDILNAKQNEVGLELLKSMTEEQKVVLQEIIDQTDGYTSAVAKLRSEIRKGTFGFGTEEQNPEAERYKGLLDLYQKVDDAREKLNAKEKIRNGIKDAIAGLPEEFQKLEQQIQRAGNLDNPFLKQADEMAKAVEKLDLKIKESIDAYGESDKRTQDLIEGRKRLAALAAEASFAAVNDNVDKELLAIKRADAEKRTIDDNTLQDKINNLNEYLANVELTEDQRVAIMAKRDQLVVAQRKAAMDKMIANDPFANQLKQWGDLTKNTSQFMANSLSSFSNTFADFVVKGKADWKGLVDSLLKDAVRLATNWAFSMLLGGGGGMKGGMKGGATGGGKKSLLTGVRHEGGIIGQGRERSRFVNPAVFLGAQRFHTGGMIQGMGLAPGEVPIIAQKGEGVFTKDQMRSMASNQSGRPIALTSNVTVNASGGTPEQNDDLAKKVSSQVEGSIRGLVAKELRAQMRPGGTLSR